MTFLPPDPPNQSPAQRKRKKKKRKFPSQSGFWTMMKRKKAVEEPARVCGPSNKVELDPDLRFGLEKAKRQLESLRQDLTQFRDRLISARGSLDRITTEESETLEGVEVVIMRKEQDILGLEFDIHWATDYAAGSRAN
ncbi:hypothetical protein B0T17DRAFT_530275 [Bombardia bombarda]|uniref:Uncharacterized protein n=1 Tax=Bombardia bombarda TaxID=252184 RepID=A0AA39XC11_9PEZI|nr:hypothetical protein B0T17DRAFT_530275 [Bombardia bombarda]